jgi:hypothetical protein
MWQRHTTPILVPATMLAILGLTSPARAQDEDPPEPAEAQPAEPESTMSDEQFEQWIFGKRIQAAQKLFDSWLEKEIDRVDRTYRLTPEQKKKLELAGRASLKRVFDRFETAREQLHRAGGDFSRIGPVLQELQAFQQAPHDYLFGGDSLLAKTLKRTLTPAQISDREKILYEGRVEWMASLLDKALGLNVDQHRRLVGLIVEETPPLRRYGTFDYDAIMLQTSRLPRDKLKTILDDVQFRKLVIRYEQARRLESVLIGEGYVAASPAETRRPSTGQGGSRPEVRDARHQREVLVGTGQAGRD